MDFQSEHNIIKTEGGLDEPQADVSSTLEADTTKKPSITPHIASLSFPSLWDKAQ